MPNVRADPGSSLVDWLWMGAGAPGVCMLDLFPGVLVSSLIGNKDLNNIFTAFIMAEGKG